MQPLHVLHLDANASDVERILDGLVSTGLNATVQRVSRRDELCDALAQQRFDLILAEVPRLEDGAVSAVEYAGRCQPNVPVIVVSGAIGDDGAARRVRRDVVEFIVKDRIDRLAQTPQSAQDYANDERPRRTIEPHGQAGNGHLAASDDNAADAISSIDEQGAVRDFNRAAERQAEANFARAYEELRCKNSEMEQSIFSVTHDLKSLLVTIQGYTAQCRRDMREHRTDRLAGFLGRIEAAAVRMARLIGDLLDFSRVGRVINPASEVGMTDLIHAVLRNHDERIRQSGARVSVQAGIPTLTVDRERIAQVFDNLIANALAHARSPGQLRIEIGQVDAPDAYQFFVRDNGLGVPAAYHQRIFELFQSAGAPTSGSGVGLAIVKRIAEAHGGRAWVESLAGQGATFWVSLPKRPVEAGAPNMPAGAVVPEPVAPSTR